MTSVPMSTFLRNFSITGGNARAIRPGRPGRLLTRGSGKEVVLPPPPPLNYPKTLRMFMWANGLQCIVPCGRAVATNTEHNPVGSARGS